MTRLMNKETAEQTPLTAAENAMNDGIKAKLEAHEFILNEGQRIKSLSPIIGNYKELIAAAIPQQ